MAATTRSFVVIIDVLLKMAFFNFLQKRVISSQLRVREANNRTHGRRLYHYFYDYSKEYLLQSCRNIRNIHRHEFWLARDRHHLARWWGEAMIEFLSLKRPLPFDGLSHDHAIEIHVQREYQPNSSRWLVHVLQATIFDSHAGSDYGAVMAKRLKLQNGKISFQWESRRSLDEDDYWDVIDPSKWTHIID